MVAGRPGRKARRDVAADLLRALETSLRTRSHLDISAEEIARQANAYPNMIRYYYGSKDGLLAAAIDRLVGRADEMLRQLERGILREADPTRGLVRAMIIPYYASPHVTGIMLIESYRPGSPLMGMYSGRGAWRVFFRVERLIRRLIAAGIYRADLDPRRACLSLLSLASGPMTIGPLRGADETSAADRFDADLWIDHVSALLDGGFRVAQARSHPSGTFAAT